MQVLDFHQQSTGNRDWIYIYGHFGCSDQSTTGVIAISMRIDNPVNTIAMSTKLKSVSFS